MYLWPSTNPLLHVCPDVGVSHFDAATAKTGDGLALVAARPVIAETGDCLALFAAAKPATATTATTTSALRRVDDGFATSGACGHECVWASSLDDLGLGSRARSSSGMGLRTAMLNINSGLSV